MNKKKTISTLLLALFLSSTPLASGNITVFAQETGNTILHQNVEQANVPILQDTFKDPSYYSNGLPDNIQIEKRDFNSENVVLDVKFNSMAYIGNNFLLVDKRNYELDDFIKSLMFIGNVMKPEGVDDFAANFSNSYTKIDLSSLNAKGYIRKDNKVVQYFSEIIDGISYEKMRDEKTPSVIPKGTVAFSIILDRNSPLIRDMKVERTTGFEKITSSFITPNQESRLDYHTSTGITNQEAFSIAKTIGTSFTFGFTAGAETPIGGGKGTLSANMSYTIQNSLTKTFSSSYSVTSSEEIGGTHVFSSKDGLNHRVGIYKYVETYKSKPIFNQSLKDQYPFLYPTSETKMNVKNIQSLDVSSADQLRSIITVRDSSFNGLKPQIIDFKQLTGQAPTYNSTNKTFNVVNSTFDLVVNVEETGYYNLPWYPNTNMLNTGSIVGNVVGENLWPLGSMITLQRGLNTIRIEVRGTCNLLGLELVKSPTPFIQ